GFPTQLHLGGARRGGAGQGPRALCAAAVARTALAVVVVVQRSVPRRNRGLLRDRQRTPIQIIVGGEERIRAADGGRDRAPVGPREDIQFGGQQLGVQLG